jgi:hypothetical protein
MYALDGKALSWADELWATGRASGLPYCIAVFTLLPFVHSEELSAQEVRPLGASHALRHSGAGGVTGLFRGPNEQPLITVLLFSSFTRVTRLPECPVVTNAENWCRVGSGAWCTTTI